MKTRPRLKFSPLLAVGGAVIHLGIFLTVGFVTIEIFTKAGNAPLLWTGIVIEIILNPTLLILYFSGIRPIPEYISLPSTALSSALYGVVISLLVSKLPKRRTEITEPVEKTESNADPY